MNYIAYFHDKVVGKISYHKQKAAEKFYKKLHVCGHVYMFHCVSEHRESWYDKDYSISVESLNRFVALLQNKGMKIRPIADILRSHGKYGYITFDDGYEGLYTEAYPILKQRGIPFTIFVTTDYLDQESYLTTDMLKELSMEPLCTIGAHTISHCKLRKCSKKELKKEIIEGKQRLEEMIDMPVEYMAYPFGSIDACPKRALKMTKKAGYMAAFSTLQTHVTARAIVDGYFIPRINVNEENYKEVADEAKVMR